MPDLLARVPLLSPSPDAPRGLDPEDISPGVEGFLVTGVLAVVVVLLVLSCVRRLRRMRHRAEVEAAAERDAAPATGSVTEAGAAPDDRPATGAGARRQDPHQPDRPGERHLE